MPGAFIGKTWVMINPPSGKFLRVMFPPCFLAISLAMRSQRPILPACQLRSALSDARNFVILLSSTLGKISPIPCGDITQA